MDKLYRLKKRLNNVEASSLDEGFKSAILEALSDDLNISKALAVLDEMINYANEFLDSNPKDNAKKSIFLANLDWMQTLMGIGLHRLTDYFQLGVSEAQKAEIEALVEKRSEAKQAKDFA